MVRMQPVPEVRRLNSLSSRSEASLSSSVSKDSELAVSIVICTRSRPGYLRKCLEAVAQLTPAADEVLVVDNTDGDAQTELIAHEFGARYTIEKMPGLSRARNRGIAESRCDIVAYLDDDAAPEIHWLGFLREPFSDLNIAAVTGRLLIPDSDTKSNLLLPRRLSNKDPMWFEIAAFGGLGLGSNMAVRKSAADGRVIFEERLGRGAPFQIAEEHYALACFVSWGYTVVYVPEAIVFHPPRRRRDVEQEARNSIAYSWLLFFEFPDHRLDLLRFLIRRMRGQRLTWPRDTQEPGEIVTSGWRVLLKAALSATWLFLRTKRPRRPMSS